MRGAWGELGRGLHTRGLTFLVLVFSFSPFMSILELVTLALVGLSLSLIRKALKEDKTKPPEK